MKKQLKADISLIIVTLAWGLSYYYMDVALADLGAFTLNAYRFLGAFVVAAILLFPKIKTVNKETLKYSVYIGTALVFVYIGATFGVQYTTLSNSGFLCAMTVVFTPILSLVFFKKVPDKKSIISVLMCFVGIALLTLKDDFSINLEHIKGDVLCIMCGFFYAIDLLITEKAASRENVNMLQVGIFQLGVTGLYNLILAIFIETPHIPTDGDVIFAVVFLSLFCTGVAFIVQAIAQKYTTASHVGIIFTLEPVFAAIAAFVLIGEVMSMKSYIGAGIMFLAIIFMEVDLKKIGEKNR